MQEPYKGKELPVQTLAKVELKKQFQPQTKSQKKQAQSQSSPKISKEESKINGKILGLVIYEVAKQENSIFSEEQKQPIKISTVGVFLFLSAATLLNLSNVLIKPGQKHKKWFLISSLSNFVGSLILGGYGLYNVMKMYRMVPQSEWARIAAEKKIYQKLGINQQKQFLRMKKQDNYLEKLKSIENLKSELILQTKDKKDITK